MNCLICNNSFISKNNNQKYCGVNCNAKAYRLRNLDKVKESKAKYSKNNRKKITKAVTIWRDKNKDKMKQYRQNRKEKDAKYWKNRRSEDIIFKLKNTLRNRLNSAIKNNQKAGSAVSDLGCSIEEFKVYIQKLFQEDMNWDNHGEWHIDHIKPLDSFDLINREELLKACHYTNLQPLWAKDNLKKWSNYEQ